MSNRRYIMPVSEVKKHLYRRVNLLGVIVEFSIPWRSEGTDYCTILKIVDQSQHSPELCVNVFTEHKYELPLIRSHRDFILLSCVRIEPYKQEVCAVFNKHFSSFALFDGKLSQGFSPYQTFPTFFLLDYDKDFITRLRDWCLTFQFDAGSLTKGISKYVLSLKDMKAREYFDLICEVLGGYEVSCDKWMLFVWDGTDAPPLSLNGKLKDEEKKALPLQIGDPLPVNILFKFPCVGTVLRLTADKAYGELGHYFQTIGKWVRIRNLFCETEFGLWKGCLTRRTKIRLLSEDDNSVVERQRNCTERLSQHGRVPLSSCHISNFLTVTDYEHVKFLTLMDLLTLEQAEGKFKCVVRMVAVYPSQCEDFRSPGGQYRIRMTIEDPTARIHALLCGEAAEMFFGGYPDADILARRMKKLLGVPQCEDFPRNPPWTQCCIGFHSSDKDDVLGSRYFHICNTRLV